MRSSKRGDYRDYYDDALRKQVANKYEEEIEPVQVCFLTPAAAEGSSVSRIEPTHRFYFGSCAIQVILRPLPCRSLGCTRLCATYLFLKILDLKADVKSCLSRS